MRVDELVSLVEAEWNRNGGAQLRVSLVMHLARDAVVPLYATVGEYFQKGDVMHVAGTRHAIDPTPRRATKKKQDPNTDFSGVVPPVLVCQAMSPAQWW